MADFGYFLPSAGLLNHDQFTPQADTPRLFLVALLRRVGFAGIVSAEMVDLAEHRADAAHLPHKPFHGAPISVAALGR
jgi:hypothetical protein